MILQLFFEFGWVDLGHHAKFFSKFMILDDTHTVMRSNFYSILS